MAGWESRDLKGANSLAGGDPAGAVFGQTRDHGCPGDRLPIGAQGNAAKSGGARGGLGLTESGNRLAITSGNGEYSAQHSDGESGAEACRGPGWADPLD